MGFRNIDKLAILQMQVRQIGFPKLVQVEVFDNFDSKFWLFRLSPGFYISIFIG